MTEIDLGITPQFVLHKLCSPLHCTFKSMQTSQKYSFKCTFCYIQWLLHSALPNNYGKHSVPVCFFLKGVNLPSSRTPPPAKKKGNNNNNEILVFLLLQDKLLILKISDYLDLIHFFKYYKWLLTSWQNNLIFARLYLVWYFTIFINSTIQPVAGLMIFQSIVKVQPKFWHKDIIPYFSRLFKRSITCIRKGLIRTFLLSVINLLKLF